MDETQTDQENEDFYISSTSNTIRTRIEPYIKPLLVLLSLIFLLLVFFVGVGLGGYKVCYDLGGFLDDKFICNLEYYEERKKQMEQNLKNQFNFSYAETDIFARFEK